MHKNRRVFAVVLAGLMMVNSFLSVEATEYPAECPVGADAAEYTAGVDVTSEIEDEVCVAGDDVAVVVTENDTAAGREASDVTTSSDEDALEVENAAWNDADMKQESDDATTPSGEGASGAEVVTENDDASAEQADIADPDEILLQTENDAGEIVPALIEKNPLSSDAPLLSEPVYFERTLGEYYVNESAGFRSFNEEGAEEKPSDYYYRMYNQLTEQSKQVYDALANADLKNPDFTTEVELTTAIAAEQFSETVFYAVAALDMDAQQLFWLNTNAIGFQYPLTEDGIVTKVIIGRRDVFASFISPAYQDWAAVQADLDKMEEAKGQILRSIGDDFNFYQKIEAINDYLIDMNYYNRYIAKGKEPAEGVGILEKAYMASSALTEQVWLTSSTDMGDPTSPVCEGYARALKVVCDELGIPCIIVCGRETGTAGGHMWNYVQDEETDIWYAVDCTWNDPVRADEWTVKETPEKDRHAYLLVGSQTPDSNYTGKTFIEKHPANACIWKPGKPFEVPVLSETALEPSQCTVSFDANGGVTDVKYKLVKIGESFGELPTASRINYIFQGWFTEREGGEPVSPEMICTESMTLYAQWMINEELRVMATAKPVASIPDGVAVEAGTKIYLHSDTRGATILYTLDGSSPADENNEAVRYYESGIVVDEAVIIYAMAVKEGFAASDVAEFSYTLADDSGDWGDAKILTEEELLQAGIESPSDIPSELWVVGVCDRNYTGSAIKFSGLKVFRGKKLLTSEDYTVKYSKNKDAGEATVTITGKGNYTGKIVTYFTINPIDLSSEEAGVIAPGVVVYANGKRQKKTTPVSCLINGKRVSLKKNVDFKYVYGEVSEDEEGNVTISELEDGAFVEAGEEPYIVTILGKAPNFVGMASFTVTILDKASEEIKVKQVSKLKIKIPTLTLRGEEEEKTPKVTVKDGSKKLKEGEHYEITFEGVDKAGAATAYITGISEGGYVGTKIVKFKVKGMPIKKMKISGVDSTGYAYTGSPVTIESMPDFAVSGTTGYDEDGEKIVTVLEPGVDYKVSYANNISKGKATITCKGIGKYTGTLKKTFSIKAYNISNEEETRITVDEIAPAVYQKNGAIPAVVVRDEGNILKSGVDYTLSYADNSSVGIENGAIVNISGKGNYTGKITKQFSVLRNSIKNVNASISDVVYTGKVMKKAPVVTLTDSNGKKLQAGVDYEKEIRFVYAKDGKEFDYREDVLDAGTEIRAVITGMGNYVGVDSTNPDVKTTEFCCVEADISKAVVKVKNQIYTGKSVHPTKADVTDIHIGKGSNAQELTSSDYEIVSYGTNIARGKGKGTMVIRGLGNYGGTKKVTFTIVARSMHYCIYYEKNAEDAKGTMKPSQIAAGRKLTGNMFSRAGYKFTGWNTEPDGSGSSYENGEAFRWKDILKTVVFGCDITLYAQWEEG